MLNNVYSLTFEFDSYILFQIWKDQMIRENISKTTGYLVWIIFQETIIIVQSTEIVRLVTF